MGSDFGGHLFTVHTGFEHLTKDFGHVCTGPPSTTFERTPPQADSRLLHSAVRALARTIGRLHLVEVLRGLTNQTIFDCESRCS